MVFIFRGFLEHVYELDVTQKYILITTTTTPHSKFRFFFY